MSITAQTRLDGVPNPVKSFSFRLDDRVAAFADAVNCVDDEYEYEDEDEECM